MSSLNIDKPGKSRLELLDEGVKYVFLNVIEDAIKNRQKVVVKRDGKIMEVSPRKLKKELLENYPELAAKLKPRN